MQHLNSRAAGRVPLKAAVTSMQYGLQVLHGHADIDVLYILHDGMPVKCWCHKLTSIRPMLCDDHTRGD